MQLDLLPKLTKDYILKYITQEQIFERYTGLHVDTKDRFVVPALLRSGRRDRDPSGTFRWSGSKLRFRDWSGNFWGDCFDVVGIVEQVDISSKVGFAVVLDRIAHDFRLHKYSSGEYTPRAIPEKLITTGEQEDTFVTLEITPRDWDSHDAKIWTKWFIYKPALDYYDVIPCEEIYKNGELVYVYVEHDPAYAYSWGKDAKGRNLYKIYFPCRRKKYQSRFWMNSAPIEGINKFKKAEIGVITKSYKDVICLKCITGNDFSIEAIAPPSEAVLIPDYIYQRMWADCDYIVSLMDFDFAGRNMAWKLRTVYNVPPLFLLNGTRGARTNHGSKDFSDYVDKNGRDNALFLVDGAVKYIKTKFNKIK